MMLPSIWKTLSVLQRTFQTLDDVFLLVGVGMGHGFLARFSLLPLEGPWSVSVDTTLQHDTTIHGRERIPAQSGALAWRQWMHEKGVATDRQYWDEIHAGKPAKIHLCCHPLVQVALANWRFWSRSCYYRNAGVSLLPKTSNPSTLILGIGVNISMTGNIHYARRPFAFTLLIRDSYDTCGLYEAPEDG